METRTIEPPVLAGMTVKLIVGVFFVLLGLLLTLDNFGVFDSEPYLAFWPVLLIIIGVIKLLGNGSRLFAVALILVGAWLTADNLGYVDFTLFDLWPLLLIGGGIAMVARAVGYVPRRSNSAESSGTVWGVFATRRIAETSREFGGKRYVALLGSCEIDLTGAEIAQSPAVIETIAFWGGIEIFVPDRWEIVGEVVPFMGGFELQARPISAPQKRLIVKGAAIMGGVEVKNAMRGAS